MKKVIYKYELEVQDIIEVTMPIGAEILDLQVQNNTPCLWALVDRSEGKEVRKFRTIGTGHYIWDKEIPCKKYIGTYQLQSGFVFHLFEVPF